MTKQDIIDRIKCIINKFTLLKTELTAGNRLMAASIVKDIISSLGIVNKALMMSKYDITFILTLQVITLSVLSFDSSNNTTANKLRSITKNISSLESIIDGINEV